MTPLCWASMIFGAGASSLQIPTLSWIDRAALYAQGQTSASPISKGCEDPHQGPPTLLFSMPELPLQ